MPSHFHVPAYKCTNFRRYGIIRLAHMAFAAPSNSWQRKPTVTYHACDNLDPIVGNKRWLSATFSAVQSGGLVCFAFGPVVVVVWLSAESDMNRGPCERRL